MKILFITNSSIKTGAEAVLYNFINNMSCPSLVATGIICRQSGNFYDRLSSKINIYKFEYTIKLLVLLALRLIFSFLNNNNYLKASIKKRLFVEYIDHIYKKNKPDILYINTIDIPEAVEYAEKNKIRCIVHSHELEQMLVNLSRSELQRLVKYPDLIVGCSQTAVNVMKILGRTQAIEVCFPGLEFDSIKEGKDSSTRTKNKLGIPKDIFVWAASGTIDTNKNPVRFVDIAYELLRKRQQESHFIWIGADKSNGLFEYVKSYASYRGVDKHITWIKRLDGQEYFDYLNIADGVLITSNRESLSIVALEAIALGKVFVSSDCGGVRELSFDSTNRIVQSWNINDFVDEMIVVMNQEKSTLSLKQNQSLQKFNIQQQTNRWENLIKVYTTKING